MVDQYRHADQNPIFALGLPMLAPQRHADAIPLETMPIKNQRRANIGTPAYARYCLPTSSLYRADIDIPTIY